MKAMATYGVYQAILNSVVDMEIEDNKEDKQ